MPGQCILDRNSVNQLVLWSVSQTLHPFTSLTIILSVNYLLVNQSVSQSFSPLVSHSLSQLVGRSFISHSENNSVCKSPARLVRLAVCQAVSDILFSITHTLSLWLFSEKFSLFNSQQTVKRISYILLRQQDNNSWFVCFLFCFLFFSGHYSFVSCILMVHTFNSRSFQ